MTWGNGASGAGPQDGHGRSLSLELCGGQCAPRGPSTELWGSCDLTPLCLSFLKCQTGAARRTDPPVAAVAGSQD